MARPVGRLVVAGAVVAFLLGLLFLVATPGVPVALTGPSEAGGLTATPTLTPVASTDKPVDRTGSPRGVTADGLDSATALT